MVPVERSMPIFAMPFPIVPVFIFMIAVPAFAAVVATIEKVLQVHYRLLYFPVLGMMQVDIAPFKFRPPGIVLQVSVIRTTERRPNRPRG